MPTRIKWLPASSKPVTGLKSEIIIHNDKFEKAELFSLFYFKKIYYFYENLFWMKRILILFAHPAYHKSKINKRMAGAIQDMEGVTLNNLYENYPDFCINRKKEQELLKQNDIIVWHHPFYWYSAPALLKEWFDIVLQHGFAFGPKGKALKGKTAFSVVSTGGRKEYYSLSGDNQYSMNQFLIPFKQSARLCEMDYLPPFVVHGSHNLTEAEIDGYAENYRRLLEMLRDDLYKPYELHFHKYLNELFY